MMQNNKPDDFVITSGFNYSIKDFINIVCNRLSLNVKWRGKGLDEILIDQINYKTIIKINKKYFRPLDIKNSSGNSIKAKRYLKWECKKSFVNLLDDMISFEKRN